jgi:hypothetical protein
VTKLWTELLNYYLPSKYRRKFGRLGSSTKQMSSRDDILPTTAIPMYQELQANTDRPANSSQSYRYHAGLNSMSRVAHDRGAYADAYKYFDVRGREAYSK